MAVLIAINVVVLSNLSNASEKLAEQQSTVVKTKQELEATNKSLKKVNDEKLKAQASLKEQRLKHEKLYKENTALKAKLQVTKANYQAKQTARETPQVKAPTVKVTGSKQEWLAQSGIPNDVWGHVDYLVTRESGWNPNAVNASSGACGLGQQLPCGKWAGAWNDPVAALKGMHSYVLGRYGSWANAVAHSQANGWY